MVGMLMNCPSAILGPSPLGWPWFLALASIPIPLAQCYSSHPNTVILEMRCCWCQLYQISKVNATLKVW